eukprot:6136165-Amphidinium_carterae.1
MVQTGPWSWFDCVTTTDHTHVETAVMLTLQPHVKRPKRTPKAVFVNDAHALAYASRILHELPDWQPPQDPKVYMQAALAKVEQTVRSSAPVVSVVKKLWISPETWSLMRTVNKWRRLLTAWRRYDLPYTNQLLAELGYPSFGPLLQILHIDDNTPSAYRDVAVLRIQLLVRQVRRALKTERSAWFEDVCASVAAGNNGDHARKLHAAVRTLSKSVAPRGRQIAHADGTVVRDAEEVQKLWHQHWGTHFSAHPVAAHNFADRLTMASSVIPAQCRDCRDPLSEPALVFTEHEVALALKTMPVKKATADAVPAAALTLAASKLSQPLAALFNACLQSGDLPLAYAGARVVPVYKRKGSIFHTKSYRPISLLTLEAKLFARLCLRSLEAQLCYHHSQFGTGH